MALSFNSISRVFLAATMAVALAGCPGESEPEKKQRVEAAPADAAARKGWLDQFDPLAPELWLASREAGRDVAPSAPAVAEWRVLLADIDSRYDETDRMIANRAVQLEGMLRDAGIRESARDLIGSFTPLAEKGARRGFGELCQHYYNLRAKGTERTAALEALRAPGGGTAQ